jgi:hypothetical protein
MKRFINDARSSEPVGKVLMVLLCSGSALISVFGAVAQTPLPGWYLHQNDPNPFCNAGAGGTTIEFELADQAAVKLTVWDEDMTTVVLTLVDGALAPGFHQVVWSGRDHLGHLVVEGHYPYRLEVWAWPLAGEEAGARQEPFFEDTKTATVQCATPIHLRSWSVIKALFE